MDSIIFKENYMSKKKKKNRPNIFWELFIIVIVTLLSIWYKNSPQVHESSNK